MSSQLFQVTDTSAIDALHAYAASQELKGRGMATTLRRLAKYLVSYALHRIPKGDKNKVETYLMQQVANLRAAKISAASRLTASSSKASRASAERIDRLRNTLAARIVAALDIYGARGMSAAAFYQRVNRFIARRKTSVNVHRASFIEAKQALGVGASGVPSMRSESPGDFRQSLSADAAEIIIDAWGSARPNKANPNPKGMQGIAPGAFSGAMDDLIRNMQAWMAKDALNAARRRGFTVS